MSAAPIVMAMRVRRYVNGRQLVLDTAIALMAPYASAWAISLASLAGLAFKVHTATIAISCVTPRKDAAEMEYATLVENARALTDSQGMIAAHATTDMVRSAEKSARGRLRALVAEGVLVMANVNALMVFQAMIAPHVLLDCMGPIATSSATLKRPVTTTGGARMMENASVTMASSGVTEEVVKVFYELAREVPQISFTLYGEPLRSWQFVILTSLEPREALSSVFCPSKNPYHRGSERDRSEESEAACIWT
jgi:hypothetical protein